MFNMKKKKLSIEIEMHNFNRIQYKRTCISIELGCKIEISKMTDKFCWREWLYCMVYKTD